MKYKVVLRCENCGALINETEEIDNLELTREIYQDALLNPLPGWCWCGVCGVKPTPRIIELKDEAISEGHTVYFIPKRQIDLGRGGNVRNER